MADVVFVTFDGGGNVPPVIGIATELRKRGHRVRVLGQEQQQAAFASADLGFTPYRRAAEWSAIARPRGTLGQFAALTAVCGSRGMGQDLLDLVRDDPPDVVVIDAMLVGTLAAAARAHLRHVCLVHTFFGYDNGPLYRGPWGIVLRMQRLDARKLWRRADLVLVCSDRDLDPARSVPDNVLWTGAVQDESAPPAHASSRRVLVSFSTTYYLGQARALQNVLDGLATMNVDAVVTTGPAVDPTRLRAPRNATVHQYVPHNELLSGCVAVIGHGGHATTFRALAYGLPLLIIPMQPMADQPMIGKVVAAAGAGKVLRKKAPPNEIRDALGDLLDSPSYRSAAATIGDRIRATDGATIGADRILELVDRPT